MVIELCISLLIVCTFSSIPIMLRLHKRKQEGSFLRIFAITLYVFVYFVSGIVHLLNLRGRFGARGPNDLLENSNPYVIFQTTILSLIGYIALLIGMFSFKSIKSSVDSDFKTQIRPITISLVLGVSILLGVSAYQKLLMYRDLKKIVRIISVENDIGRNVYLTNWLVTSILIVTIMILTHSKKNLIKLTTLIVSFLIMARLLSWNNSRGTIAFIFIALTYCIFSDKRIVLAKKAKIFFLLVALPTYCIFFAVALLARFEKSTLSNFSFVSLLDWELGRFGMLGAMVDYTDQTGLQLGITFLSSILRVFSGVINVIGYSEISSAASLPLIQNLAGNYVNPDASIIHFVPGFLSEIYVNFGFIGVFIGYLFLGRALSLLQSKAQKKVDILIRFYWTYIYVLLVFNITMNSSIGLLGQIFVGLMPFHVIMLFGIKKYKKKSFEQNYLKSGT